MKYCNAFLSKRQILATFLSTAFLLTRTVQAASLVDPINKNSAGIAIKGYDPVAYFELGKAEKGSALFSAQWGGATWHFASDSNRAQFTATPEKYLPQYGGYCAWAVSHGYTAGIDPEAWKIESGKLYLNYSKDIQGKWMKDSTRYISDGNRVWLSLHK